MLHVSSKEDSNNNNNNKDNDKKTLYIIVYSVSFVLLKLINTYQPHQDTCVLSTEIYPFLYVYGRRLGKV